MAEANTGPRPADPRFLAGLPAEVEHWRASGIISGEQARAILGSYDFPEAAEAPRNRLVTVLLIMGAVLVGLGVILFVAANWQEISSGVKLAMMLIGVPVIYAIGFILRYRLGYERVGTAVILTGAICYGAAIHLVAQTYHIPVNHPNLVLYWFLGVLPLAYLVRSQPVMVLALVTGLAAVGFRGQEWLPNLDENLIPTLAMPLYLALGLAVFGLGRLQESFPYTRTFTPTFLLIGLLTTFGILYFWGFQDIWEWSEFPWSYSDGIFPVTIEYWAIVAAAVAVLAGAWAWMVLRARGRGESLPTLLTEALPSLVLLLFAAVVVFLPVDGSIAYPILANLLYALGVVGLVVLGYRSNRETLINLSIAFFCIWIFTRYFEFGWDLLDRSVIFIVAGLILLVGGFLLERGRRRVLRQMRSQDASPEEGP